MIDAIQNWRKFTKLEKLGTGSFGEVRAYKNYAIKIVDEGDMLDGEILKNLQSVENVPRLYAIVDDNAMITELIDGCTVSEYEHIGRENNFVNPSFNIVFEETLKDILHKGYLPYDLHSSNVMIKSDTGLPVIIDVGLFEKNETDRDFSDKDNINVRAVYSSSKAMEWVAGDIAKWIRIKEKAQ